ncbi:MAG: nucleotide exchange factor GrpE [Candidatus Brennerbacteria bacterium CG11_big_fil_rev_8_21_14_0_20_43_10]|uniref:Protein GrpE n=3 Tax=Candidatus Brenneribacteriota TaxID=1817902 RepID=A0A2M8C3B6_9BACT|nr:MAG: nucleotide exchange factor GrpE [Parcubacteria group bacterium CG1_02_44_31]PIP50422.1 MAG: nucleotide exchange factor GrpE [Candidatus Brennerbacteria bacterium CG23_combo_of_CG06-09_8_20_14_all_44_41]PIR26787.1 MAG: nucleotide exchange factor GrpE [Candidatus Brennerbacteria bacterium CG11_big_fil_rev_8_21_14_0_20_43_10]PIX28993.1 MAG: nucleotide exchange factor GrpE [Candidatus Brennerbacteria bacterium CG_4_8_14_3_um_filter_43_14]PJA18935.1 MAG: nucleotide exchange factor GrpE [Cand
MAEEKKQEEKKHTKHGDGDSYQSCEKLRKELEECAKIRDEYLAGWQRARADYANYQKAETERVSRIAQFTNEDLLYDLLVIIDSFHLAVSHAQTEQEKKSFDLICTQFESILKKRGLEEIPANTGDQFNPELHEVIESVAQEGKSSGSICEVVHKGYMLYGKVLRAARVKIVQ